MLPARLHQAGPRSVIERHRASLALWVYRNRTAAFQAAKTGSIPVQSTLPAQLNWIERHPLHVKAVRSSRTRGTRGRSSVGELPAHNRMRVRSIRTVPISGAMSEWQGVALQKRLGRFNSGSRLNRL